MTGRERRRWAAWIGVVLFGSLAVAAGTSALARPAGPPDPRLAPGSRVVVVEDGFAARAVVTVGLAGDRLLATIDADAHGRVAYRFTVPLAISTGAHSLLFAGRSAHQDRNQHRGNLVVTAPLVRAWRFRVGSGPSGGTSAPGSAGNSSHPGHPGHPGGSGAAGGSAGHGGRAGGTSGTGSDVLAVLTLGLVALAAGGALVLAARRRRPARRG